MPPRPTAVTVFGILNIVFAAFGFFGVLALVALPYLPGQDKNPALQLAKVNTLYGFAMNATKVWAALGCIMMLLAGIGLMKLKPWGRTLSIAYSILAILMTIAGTLVNVFILFPAMMEVAHQSQGPEALAAQIGAYSGTVGGCFGVIYPILLLIFATRRNFAAAFRPAATPPPVPMV